MDKWINRIVSLLGLQGDFALGKDRLQVDQNGSDPCHLLQETHHHRDKDWPVVVGCGKLRPCNSTLCVDAVLYWWKHKT